MVLKKYQVPGTVPSGKPPKSEPYRTVPYHAVEKRHLLLWSQLSAGHSLGPPRVVLGFLLTVLVIILTPRGEILRGAPDRGRLSVVLYVFHFLIIAPTVDFFTPSCLPIADSVFPAWCRSTILFLVSFDSSLVLAIVEFGV